MNIPLREPFPTWHKNHEQELMASYNANEKILAVDDWTYEDFAVEVYFETLGIS
jgi:hypothetical protein